jgi:Protein of unknown function (DUF5131)/Transposase zinc-binding domain
MRGQMLARERELRMLQRAGIPTASAELLLPRMNAACCHTEISYNSCGNRHCPKCQGAASRRWLTDREAELLGAPAAVRFISAEPLLGPLNIRNYVSDKKNRGPRLDWVIVGGESGPRARPMDPAWVEKIRVQCDRSDAAFFFKQWGGKNKKAAGRKLNGRTYDAMPLVEESALT